jgi:hypothetical protein
MPVFFQGTQPSEALPDSLQVASAIFDQWKLSGVRGMMKVQSFAFRLVEELVEKVCWKAVTHDERIGEEMTVIVVLDSSWVEWFLPRVGFHLAVLDAHLCGVLDGCLVFMVGKEGHSFLARRWVDEELRCLELFAGIGGWSAASPFWTRTAAWCPLNWTCNEHWRWARCAGVRLCLLIFFCRTCRTLILSSLGMFVIVGGSSSRCLGLFGSCCNLHPVRPSLGAGIDSVSMWKLGSCYFMG